MNPHLDTAARAARAMDSAVRRRDRAIVAAREDGCTWRSIALAVGMTEVGVQKVVARWRRDHPVAGPDGR